MHWLLLLLLLLPPLAAAAGPALVSRGGQLVMELDGTPMFVVDDSAAGAGTAPAPSASLVARLLAAQEAVDAAHMARWAALVVC